MKKVGRSNHFDSNLGYTKGNVQWVHKTINIMKQDLSDSDFINWCGMVVKYNV